MSNFKEVQIHKISKELFETVYGWGRANIVVDEKSPTYQFILKSLIYAVQGKKIDFTIEDIQKEMENK